MMRYRITNWTQYQHYKDRCPPWIKLHHAMLTSEVWVMGTDATRALAIACMLLASRNKDNDGSFNGDPEYIKRFAYLNSKPDFKQLIDFKFIELAQDASTPLAPRNTEQSREETEKSRDRAEGEKRQTAQALLASLGIDEKIAADWIILRKQKKAAVTQTALSGIQREADKAGYSLETALRICCERGWAGFKAEWMQKGTSVGGVQDARLDVARQIMGGKNANHGQIIDVTPTRSDSGGGARLSETHAGVRQSNVGEVAGS